jgi:hypothetical protein
MMAKSLHDSNIISSHSLQKNVSIKQDEERLRMQVPTSIAFSRCCMDIDANSKWKL